MLTTGEAIFLVIGANDQKFSTTKQASCFGYPTNLGLQIDQATLIQMTRLAAISLTTIQRMQHRIEESCQARLTKCDELFYKAHEKGCSLQDGMCSQEVNAFDQLFLDIPLTSKHDR